TDEEQWHDDCPNGETFFCFFKKTLAKEHKQPPPTSKGKCSSFISEKMLHIYDRLTSDVFLARCLSGMTQNANESIHA
ncbi:unnamed protein product, partial [Lymnaea stagnalis]